MSLDSMRRANRSEICESAFSHEGWVRLRAPSHVVRVPPRPFQHPKRKSFGKRTAAAKRPMGPRKPLHQRDDRARKRTRAHLGRRVADQVVKVLLDDDRAEREPGETI